MDQFLNDENIVNRLVTEWRTHGSLVIAYDFDNTVFDYHSKGYEFDTIIELLRECKKFGAHLIVYTASEDERIQFIMQYLVDNNIPFDSINEQPSFIPVYGKKLYYNILLDDRAGLSSAYNSLKKALEIMKEEKANG